MPFGFNQNNQYQQSGYPMQANNDRNNYGHQQSRANNWNNNQRNNHPTNPFNISFFNNNSNNQRSPNNNQRNSSNQTQQLNSNPPMLSQPTIVPYLGPPIMPAIPTQQSNEQKPQNSQNPQNQVSFSAIQPIQNFPIATPQKTEPVKAGQIQNPAVAAKSPHNSTQNDKNSNIMPVLKDFIQNERNGNIFYDYLASLVEDKTVSIHLKDISNQCSKHHNKYKDIYINLSSEEFEASEETINTRVNLRDGLRIAMFSETEALRNLGNLISSTQDLSTREQLSCLFYDKVWALNYINLLYIV